MQIVQNTLLSNMSNDHLISTLLCKNVITDIEYELIDRLDKLNDENITFTNDAKTFNRQLERIVEQSEFRAQLLEQILDLCNKCKSKKDLVKSIHIALENSYVEL